jgi:hypothetical protein
MNIEKFASRGLRAQAAVDLIISRGENTSPAPILAGAFPSPGVGPTTTVSPRPPGGAQSAGAAIIGKSQQTGRSALPENILEKIKRSSDVTWLKSILNDRDYQFAVRQAAQRRLGALVRRPKL